MHPRHPKTGMAILEAIFKRQSSEEQLLAKLREGDAAAAAQLYRLHVRYLTAVCSRYVVNDEDVKDVLQEAFIKIFSSIHRFQPKGTGSLRSWMSRIVANEAICPMPELRWRQEMMYRYSCRLRPLCRVRE